MVPVDIFIIWTITLLAVIMLPLYLEGVEWLFNRRRARKRGKQ